MVSRRVFLVSCIAIAPVSFFGGIWLKDYFIRRTIANEGERERGMRISARVTELQQERMELLKEGEAVNAKIVELRRRMQT